MGVQVRQCALQLDLCIYISAFLRVSVCVYVRACVCKCEIVSALMCVNAFLRAHANLISAFACVQMCL